MAKKVRKIGIFGAQNLPKIAEILLKNGYFLGILGGKILISKGAGMTKRAGVSA